MQKTIEELQNEVIRLTEEAAKVTNLETQLAEKEERINSLMEHNQKLFLRITEPVKDPAPDTDPEPVDIIEFANKIASKF